VDWSARVVTAVAIFTVILVIHEMTDHDLVMTLSLFSGLAKPFEVFKWLAAMVASLLQRMR
jgi:hypothetical protein